MRIGRLARATTAFENGAEEQAAHRAFAAGAHDDQVGVDLVGLVHNVVGRLADGVGINGLHCGALEERSDGVEDALGLVVVVGLELLGRFRHVNVLRNRHLGKEDVNFGRGAEKVGPRGKELNAAKAVFGAVDRNENAHKCSSCEF
jgi:hypothetical protein